MRTVAKFETIYSLEDVKQAPELLEKVLDNYRYFNVEDVDLVEYSDIYAEKLNELGFLNPRVHYTLNYSQGDGACFDCQYFDFEKLLADSDIKHKKWLINIIRNESSFGITECGNYNLYSHEATREFLIEYNSNVADHSRISEALEDIERRIEDMRYGVCFDLYGMLKDEYEYQISDEAILETFEANDYEFTEDGKIYY